MSIVFVLILFILMMVATAFGLYYATILIIRLYTGCDNEEAVNKMRRFTNGKALMSMENDRGLQIEIEENIRNVIGDDRYKKLVSLNNSSINAPLFYYGFASGLPYIAVGVYYADENEKSILENLIKNVVIKHLEIYGHDTRVLAVWKDRFDLKMPVLMVRYATNAEQLHALEIGIKNEGQLIATVNQPIIDDTEEKLND